MPTCRTIAVRKGLWEVRANLNGGIARVLFAMVDGRMLLLNGFVKKSQKTPDREIELAMKRKKEAER